MYNPFENQYFCNISYITWTMSFRCYLKLRKILISKGDYKIRYLNITKNNIIDFSQCMTYIQSIVIVEKIFALKWKVLLQTLYHSGIHVIPTTTLYNHTPISALCTWFYCDLETTVYLTLSCSGSACILAAAATTWPWRSSTWAGTSNYGTATCSRCNSATTGT